MTGHIDHVINATGNPIVSVLVTTAAVAGEVLAFVGREIRLHEALVIAIHRAHLAGPAVGDAQVALVLAFKDVTFSIHKFGQNAKERQRCRAWLQINRARQRRYQNAAGFGLPPGVDNRAAAFADDPIVPLPSFRVDRLADRAQKAQRFSGRAFDRLVPFAHQCADCRRRGVEDRYVVLVAHVPEP